MRRLKRSLCKTLHCSHFMIGQADIMQGLYPAATQWASTATMDSWCAFPWKKPALLRSSHPIHGVHGYLMRYALVSFPIQRRRVHSFPYMGRGFLGQAPAYARQLAKLHVSGWGRRSALSSCRQPLCVLDRKRAAPRILHLGETLHVFGNKVTLSRRQRM